MSKQFRRIKKDIHGVVLLDKPSGITSNKVLQQVKGLFHARKAGHTGSLDPLATGLLPICFGQATKVSEYLLDSHKKYTTVIKLGEVTDTLDSEGAIIETTDVTIADQDIQAALNQFRGDIQQIPPMFSALKKDGQPLYKMARKGEVIDRPPRNMTVHSLEAQRINQTLLRLQVHCSSGFYIRSLAHDLGQALGCGAHVVELRRTDIKSISIDQAITLDELVSTDVQESLLPIDSLLSDMPAIEISDTQSLSLLQGRKTDANGLTTDQLTRFYKADKRLFAVGEVMDSGQLKTHKIFVDANG